MRGFRVSSGTEGTNLGAQRVEDTKTTISRAVKSAVRWQLITTLILVFAAWVFMGMNAAISVLIGGASVMMGGYTSVATMRERNNTAPSAILMTLLKAEMIRIAMIAVILLGAFKFYKGLVPLALIGGLAAAALISGAGLRTLGNENK